MASWDGPGQETSIITITNGMEAASCTRSGMVLSQAADVVCGFVGGGRWLLLVVCYVAGEWPVRCPPCCGTHFLSVTPAAGLRQARSRPASSIRASSRTKQPPSAACLINKTFAPILLSNPFRPLLFAPAPSSFPSSLFPPLPLSSSPARPSEHVHDGDISSLRPL